MSKNKIEIITLDTPGITDYSAERNNLLIKSKAEWVLFLDTDEKMSDELKDEIDNFNPGNFSGFYIKRKNYFLGQYSGTDRILRLGKRTAGKWIRSVHETWEIDGEKGELKGEILHNTADKVSEMITKINSYSTLHAEANKVEGKESNLLKIILFPKLKFIQSVLMGRGTPLSILQAFHSFLAWSKLWLSQNA